MVMEVPLKLLFGEESMLKRFVLELHSPGLGRRILLNTQVQPRTRRWVFNNLGGPSL
jgi:hypothetical protein